MMKNVRSGKIWLGFLILVLLLVSFSPLKALEPAQVTIDGIKLNFDVPPVIRNGRTLVPLRIIFESLGAAVAWDSQTGTVTGRRDDTVIKLQVDNINASKNSEFILLDVPAVIVEGRTMVPARFIAESLRADVIWHEESRTVEIRSHLPYNLTEYHILESGIRQLTAGLDESFYQEFEAHIRTKFPLDNFVLLENYLRQHYKPITAVNGTYTGQPGSSGQGIFESGGYKYVGDWYNSQMHGRGAYYFPDG